MKEAIVSYFQTQQALIDANLQLAKGTHDIEALHDLRVAVKRLKALYQIVEILSEGIFEYRAHFEDIRKLFKTVGSLRDIQVQSQLFASFVTDLEESEIIGFYQYLQKRHDKASKKLDKALYRFNPEVMNESLKDVSFLLDQKSEERGKDLVVKYLKKRLKQITKLNRVKHDERKIHLMRTRLKQLMYAMELMKMIAPDQELMQNGNNVKKAGTSLGLWHDHIVLADELQQFIKNYAILKAPYRKLLKRVRAQEAFYLSKARKRVQKVLDNR